MPTEPLISFFIIRYLIKNLKTFDPESWWIDALRKATYVVVADFVLGIIFEHGIFFWLGHLMLLALAVLVLNEKAFARSKSVVLAVLPYILLSLGGDILERVAVHVYNQIDDWVDIAKIFAVVWLVAMLLTSNKQNKALAVERKKTQEEEERNRWVNARKAELESEVMERTAEITRQKEELQHALLELKSTQAQLIQQEKLASLGELTAGIAHEIQNPLNFVNNFSDVSTELVNELKEVLVKKLPEEDKKYTDEILFDLSRNLEKITHHGRRADSIVKGMMLHSRNGTSQRLATDLNALADEFLRLSYHGFRAKEKAFNAQLVTSFEKDLPKVEVVSQEIGRVLLNLFNNAFYSLFKKKRELDGSFSPVIKVGIKRLNDEVEIKVRDNGKGIPAEVCEKIYQPFFTTKPAGEGIGLGLALSYDIVKSHGGELKVSSVEGEYAEFTLTLPYKLAVA